MSLLLFLDSKTTYFKIFQLFKSLAFLFYLNRIQHFQQMEANAQRMQKLRGEVRNQTEALFRSSVIV